MHNMNIKLYLFLLMIISCLSGQTKTNIQQEEAKQTMIRILTNQLSDSTKIFMNGLSFEQSDGTPFYFSELTGNVILLDFWATWCGPCRRQHPQVEALHHSINNPDFKLVTVSIDRNIEDWRAFLREHNWNAINLHVGWAPKNPLFQMVYESVGMHKGKELFKASVPRYFLVDKQLDIVTIEDISSAEIKVKINQLLSQ